MAELRIVLMKIFQHRLVEEYFFPYSTFEQLLVHFLLISLIRHKYLQHYLHLDAVLPLAQFL